MVKNDEFRTYLRKIQLETQFVSRKDMCPVSPQIHPKLVHIFSTFINVHTVTAEDVDRLMKTIDETVSHGLKSCILARWINLTDDVETFRAYGARERLVNRHVFGVSW